MFPGHGGDEATYEGHGTSGRGRLQIPAVERAEVVRHSGTHEEQVVQELRKDTTRTSYGFSVGES
jgi:hypothetical protein